MNMQLSFESRQVRDELKRELAVATAAASKTTAAVADHTERIAVLEEVFLGMDHVLRKMEDDQLKARCEAQARKDTERTNESIENKRGSEAQAMLLQSRMEAQEAAAKRAPLVAQIRANIAARGAQAAQSGGKFQMSAGSLFGIVGREAAVAFAAGGKIDAKAGIIYGVALCTEGPAKGHGLQCDRKTLDQLLACARTYSNGLKVKLNHGGQVGDIMGALRNLRIDGKKLVGDLHLLETYEKRDYVLELAATIPDTFGLSVAFSGPTETVGGASFARCDEIYSCDLVSEPAANPSGLFAKQ